MLSKKASLHEHQGSVRHGALIPQLLKIPHQEYFHDSKFRVGSVFVYFILPARRRGDMCVVTRSGLDFVWMKIQRTVRLVARERVAESTVSQSSDHIDENSSTSLSVH